MDGGDKRVQGEEEERRGGGELERMESLRRRKDRDESKKRDILIEGAIIG